MKIRQSRTRNFEVNEILSGTTVIVVPVSSYEYILGDVCVTAASMDWSI